MVSNKRPLWSDDKDVDEIIATIEEGNYSHYDYETMIYNLFEDIQCLKENLKDSKSEAISDLLHHFKGIRDERNKSLAESGERKYCKPFSEISVSDIKAYALSGTGFEEF